MNSLQRQIKIFIVFGLVLLTAIWYFPTHNYNNFQTTNQLIKTASNSFNINNNNVNVQAISFSATLKNFSNSSELNDYILQNAQQTLTNSQNIITPTYSNTYAANSAPSTATVNTDLTAQTNLNQYPGIIEPDVFSTDGQNLYSVSNGVVQIINSSNLQVIYTLNLTEQKQNNPIQIYKIMVFNNTLVVFGQQYANYYPIYAQPMIKAAGPMIGASASSNIVSNNSLTTAKPTEIIQGGINSVQTSPTSKTITMPICIGCMPIFQGNKNSILIYNVTNPSDPILETHMEYTGNFESARAQNNMVYAVFDQPAGLFNPRPIYFFNGIENTVSAQSIFYYENQPTDLNFQIIASLNTTEQTQTSPNMKVVLVDGYVSSSSILFSPNSIYLIHQIYHSIQPTYDIYSQVLSKYYDNQTLDELNTVEMTNYPAEIKNQLEVSITQNFLNNFDASQRDSLNIDEQMAQLLQETFANNYSTYTEIDKFDLFSLNFTGQNTIPGTVNDRYSTYQNENGYLFVASQIPQEAFGGFENCQQTTGQNQCNYVQPLVYRNSSISVYSFDPNMNIKNELSGLQEGSDSNSITFVGNYTYIQSNDNQAFLTVNLTDQNNLQTVQTNNLPQILSDYSVTKQLNNDALISIGYGKQNGSLMFSIINITNPQNVQVTSNYNVGGQGSDTSTTYDSKALFYAPQSNLIIIPVTLTDNGSYDQNYFYNYKFGGSLVFNLTNQMNLMYLGNVTEWQNYTGNSNNSPYDGFEIIRSIILNNQLYSYSSRQIIQTNLINYANQNVLNLPENSIYVNN